MLSADILQLNNTSTQISASLVWMESLDLIIETDAGWSVDQRLKFTTVLDNQTTSGVFEVRATRPHLARCRIVRIAPEDADRLTRWQARLDLAGAVPLFKNDPTTPVSARHRREALNDALKDRVRQLREDREG